MEKTSQKLDADKAMTKMTATPPTIPNSHMRRIRLISMVFWGKGATVYGRSGKQFQQKPYNQQNTSPRSLTPTNKSLASASTRLVLADGNPKPTTKPHSNSLALMLANYAHTTPPLQQRGRFQLFIDFIASLFEGRLINTL